MGMSADAVPPVEVRTLRPGGQHAEDVAGWIAAFLGRAQRSLDLAHYDFNLGAGTALVIGGSIREAAARGVAVRFVYNVDHRNPIPVPPPPEPDAQLIASLGVPSRGIAGVPDLMHHKYVVRDGEAVWMGSMNWTDESFAIQENVIATVRSPEVAARYAADFEQLWATGEVEKSGFVDPVPLDVRGTPIRAWFTPGNGEALSRASPSTSPGRSGGSGSARPSSPRRRSSPRWRNSSRRTASTSPAASTHAGARRHPPVDRERQRLVEAPAAAARAQGADLRQAVDPVAANRTPHDFMHAKVTVADDAVFLGSFNLSRSGEQNAEDVLEIHDAALAERLAAYVDEVRSVYPRFTP